MMYSFPVYCTIRKVTCLLCIARNLIVSELATFGSQVFSFPCAAALLSAWQNGSSFLGTERSVKTNSRRQTNCTWERRRLQTFAPFPACGLPACKYLFTSSSFLFYFFFSFKIVECCWLHFLSSLARSEPMQSTAFSKLHVLVALSAPAFALA